MLIYVININTWWRKNMSTKSTHLNCKISFDKYKLISCSLQALPWRHKILFQTSTYNLKFKYWNTKAPWTTVRSVSSRKGLSGSPYVRNEHPARIYLNRKYRYWHIWILNWVSVHFRWMNSIKVPNKIPIYQNKIIFHKLAIWMYNESYLCSQGILTLSTTI